MGNKLISCTEGSTCCIEKWGKGEVQKNTIDFPYVEVTEEDMLLAMPRPLVSVWSVNRNLAGGTD